MKKIAFLDRDGTLNIEKDYVHKWSDFEWIDGAKDFIRELKSRKYFVAVVTNQSGIARSFYTANDVVQLHLKMNDDLKKSHGVEIDRFEICPHHPDFSGPCTCRKPETNMLRRVVNFAGHYDDQSTFMVGDNLSDYQAGKNFRIKSFLVQSGHGAKFIDKVEDQSIITNLNEIFEKL
ncbi:MAG: HAD family hydrolase [Calditrichaeota bacterium]|nr:HAD family hydrolase [Calditrichota bacterium]